MKLKMVLKRNSYIDNLTQVKGIFVGYNHISKKVMAELLYDAYLNTVDYEGENIEETYRFINQVETSSYGKFLSEYSGILKDNGDYVSGILVSLLDDTPCIISVFTGREYKNLGYGEYIIRHVIHMIFSNTNYNEISLYVTENNKAISIYKRIGFVESQ